MSRLNSLVITVLIFLFSCAPVTYKNYKNEEFDKMANEIVSLAHNIKEKEQEIFEKIAKSDGSLKGLPGVVYYLDLAIQSAQYISDSGIRKDLLIQDIVSISKELKKIQDKRTAHEKNSNK